MENRKIRGLIQAIQCSNKRYCTEKNKEENSSKKELMEMKNTGFIRLKEHYWCLSQ